MARPLRIEYPGAVYHITGRGNEKRDVFRDDSDRELFLATIHRANSRYNWICHSYCLMDNHYHLLIETPDGNLSMGARQLNGVYTQLFNKRHGRTGHLFQGRYKAVLIQKDEHLLEVCRYVVLNPVRAGMVARAEDWKWSSYRAITGWEPPHSCLTTDWVLGQFGEERMKAEKEYRQFVQEGVGQESIWSGVKGQAVLGKDGFIDGLRDHFKKHREILEIPRSQRHANRPALEDLFGGTIVANKSDRDGMIVEAVEKYGYRQIEIARHLCLHYSTISNLLRGKGQTPK